MTLREGYWPERSTGAGSCSSKSQWDADATLIDALNRRRAERRAGETGWRPSGIGRIIGSIARPAGKITLAPQPLKVGPQWHVIGTYPGGQQEHITGFKTEASALDWIANDSRDWLIKRGYEDE